MNSPQTITIDNQTYDLATLSAEAKAQIQSLQTVERKIVELQQDLAILQTARAAYGNALRGTLPQPVKEESTPEVSGFEGDTLRFS